MRTVIDMSVVCQDVTYKKRGWIVRQSEDIRVMLKKVRKAKEIKNECELEIDKYNYQGGYFHYSRGGGN